MTEYFILGGEEKIENNYKTKKKECNSRLCQFKRRVCLNNWIKIKSTKSQTIKCGDQTKTHWKIKENRKLDKPTKSRTNKVIHHYPKPRLIPCMAKESMTNLLLGRYDMSTNVP